MKILKEDFNEADLQGIKVKGYYGKRSAVDSYKAPNGKIYYLMEDDDLGDETDYVVMTADQSEIYPTYDDIETCLRDEGIITEDENLTESWDAPTVREIKQKLQDALDILNEYDDSKPVDLVSNTYFLHSDTFLGLAGIGYLDLTNPIDTPNYDNEDWANSFIDWYNSASASDTVDADKILYKYDQDFIYEEIADLIHNIELSAADRAALSDISGITIEE